MTDSEPDESIDVHGLAYTVSLIWNRWERKVWLVSLFLACAVAYAARAAMPLCVVEISKEHDWNKSETGTVLSAFFWGYTMTQVLGGYLSDRLGAELVMTCATVGWSLLTFITPLIIHSSINLSHNGLLGTFIVLRMLTGCVQGVHFPALSSMLSRRIHSNDRAFSLSFATSGSHFGTLSIGVFGTLLLNNFGWKYPFYVIGIIGLAWVCFIWQMFMAKDCRKGFLRDTNGPPKIELVKSVPWCLLFRKCPFWAIVIGQFCGSWVFFILFSWLPTYFSETYPDASGWVFNAVPWLISIPCQWGSGWFSDRLILKGYSTIFIRKLMQVVSFCGAGGCLMLLSFIGSNYYGALFCASAAIAFCAFHHSGVVVNVQDIAPKFAGSVFGLVNTAGAIPGFVGVYVAGYLLQVSGSWTAVFNSTAAVCFLGAIVFGTCASSDKII